MDIMAPLLVSADELLVAEVHRLAAAAGVVPRVVADSAAALRAWPGASLVLVGTDCAAGMAACRPPRRTAVHVVGAGPVADGVFRSALDLGAESVAALPEAQEWLVEVLTDAEEGAGAPARVVGIVGGSGGAGASVFAAALAQVAARERPTLLLDADPLGAGADRILGMEAAEGVRWDSLGPTTGRLGARALREALPAADRLAVLGWPADRAAQLHPVAMREVLSAAVRGFDLVVVDLPRHRDQVVEEVLARCDDVVVLTRLTVPGVTAAARLVAGLPEGGPRRHLVARGGGGGVAPGAAAAVLGLPVLAEMGDQRGLDEAIDLGAGPVRSRRGPLARGARAAVATLLASGRRTAVAA